MQRLLFSCPDNILFLFLFLPLSLQLIGFTQDKVGLRLSFNKFKFFRFLLVLFYSIEQLNCILNSILSLLFNFRMKFPVRIRLYLYHIFVALRCVEVEVGIEHSSYFLFLRFSFNRDKLILFSDIHPVVLLIKVEDGRRLAVQVLLSHRSN